MMTKPISFDEKEPEPTKEPIKEPVKPSSGIELLKGEIAGLKLLLVVKNNTPQQPPQFVQQQPTQPPIYQYPPPQQPDQWQQMTSMMGFMQQMKELFPQQNTQDIINQIMSIEKARMELLGGEEPEVPMSGQERLLELFANKMMNDEQNKQPQQPTQPQGANQQMETYTDDKIPAIIEKIPGWVKNGIKNGNITEQNALNYAQSKNYPLDFATKVFKHIKGDAVEEVKTEAESPQPEPVQSDSPQTEEADKESEESKDTGDGQS